MQCGTDYNLFDLLSAAIKQHNSLAGIPDNWAWAVALRTKAATPDECGSEMTWEEKLKSCISIVECRHGNVVVVNIVLEDCACLICGSELPCNSADMDFFDKFKLTFCYTTDGEWALYLLNINPEVPA